MFDILSNKLKRQLHLLELLFEKENYRFQDIEKKLDCSAKTVRNDLNDIILYAKEIHIQMDRDVGVTVTIAPHITEDYIYRTILKESIEFRFLEAILLNHYGSYLELCEELFISESTLRRIVKKINQVLKKHQLTIRGLIKIIGKKETITQLMACLFQEKYTCLEEVFSPTICQKSRLFLTELGMYHQLQERILQLDQKENDLLLFYIASTLTQYEGVAEQEREESGKDKVTWDNWYKEQIEQMIHHPFLRKILRLDQQMMHEKTSHIRAIIDLAITYLEIKYQILCTDRTDVIERVAYGSTGRQECSYILYDRYRIFFQQSHPFIKSIQVELEKYLIREEKADEVDSEMLEKLVTWLVFHWPAVIKEREVGKQVKALLVMDGIHHADYIVGKLKLYLGNRYRFIKNDLGCLSDQARLKNTYDCIISTVALSQSSDIPVFGISVMPRTREIHNLIRFHQQNVNDFSL